MMNLEKSKDRKFFEELDDLDDIVESIFLSKGISRKKGEVLLFIDEIQESLKAIQQLRFFYEDYPDIHVIAAGSLLDFAIREVKSFPVGRVEFLYVHPVSFREFLDAIGHDRALEAIDCLPMEGFAEETLMDLFQTYTIIGGMPEVVAEYAKVRSFSELPRIYESIWGTYKEDVQKYGRNESERRIIRHIMETAPAQAEFRIKFQNFGNSNYRSREVGEAMRSLNAAGVIQLIYPTTSLKVPLAADFKKSPRLQFLDTGLLNYALGIQAQMIGFKDLADAHRGTIVQHIAYQELMALGEIRSIKPNFWVREKSQSTSEVDLAIQIGNKIMPVEIKAGPTGRLKSLHQFVNRSEHHYAIRLYGGRFTVDALTTPEGTPYKLMNMPYFLAGKLYEYAVWFLENH